MSGTLLLMASLLAQPGPVDSGQRFESQERHMGVEFRIVLYAADQQAAKRGFSAAYSRIRQLDGILSDYDPESELSQLSRRSPTDQPIRIGDDLWQVLSQSQRMSQRSQGAFDVTVGPLSRLWRRARRRKEMPSDARLAEAKAAVGFQHLRLDPPCQSVSLLQPNMRLDLGGIAKGYAADQALTELHRLAIHRALVNASGDIALGDAPPDQSGWKIGIAPLKADGPPTRFLRLANCAIATSGDAWQYVEIDGRRFSHILDPRTGLGITDRSGVTVIAPNCTSADALASAISVLGPQAGFRVVDSLPQTAALVLRAPQGETITQLSKRFERLAPQQEVP